MIACFGLWEDNHHPRVPGDRLAENRPRIDVWVLHQCGALVEGAVTRLRVGEKGLPARRTDGRHFGRRRPRAAGLGRADARR
jgi:hypothetical protein